MGEALNGLKRSLMCGEPRETNIGQKVTLMGWVQRNRKLPSNATAFTRYIIAYGGI